jgi:hypothetical protein
MNRDDSPRVKMARLKLRTAYADLAPYQEAHALRVGRMGRGDRQRIVGLWHDALEDGVATPQELFAAGLTSTDVQDVMILPKSENVAYEAYIDELCADGSTDALMVKCYDILDRLDPIRALTMSGADRQRHLSAYNAILRELGAPRRETKVHLDWLRESSGWRARMLERTGGGDADAASV